MLGSGLELSQETQDIVFPHLARGLKSFYSMLLRTAIEIDLLSYYAVFQLVSLVERCVLLQPYV